MPLPTHFSFSPASPMSKSSIRSKFPLLEVASKSRCIDSLGTISGMEHTGQLLRRLLCCRFALRRSKDVPRVLNGWSGSRGLGWSAHMPRWWVVWSHTRWFLICHCTCPKLRFSVKVHSILRGFRLEGLVWMMLHILGYMHSFVMAAVWYLHQSHSIGLHASIFENVKMPTVGGGNDAARVSGNPHLYAWLRCFEWLQGHRIQRCALWNIDSTGLKEGCRAMEWFHCGE